MAWQGGKTCAWAGVGAMAWWADDGRGGQGAARHTPRPHADLHARRWC